MTILMQIDGVEGEGRIAGHDGWFPLTSFRWGGRRAARTHTGGVLGKSAAYSTPQLTDITLTRLADSSSSLLWDHMIKGNSTPIRFHWLRAGQGGEPTSYLEAQFDDALLIAIDVGSSSGGRPTETLVFTYRALEYRVVNVGNALSGPQDVVSFNLGTA
ncbi:type VI secretion system tube protein Hcp [Neoroseomonas soli]|uniref:Type VI secretion system tube protein Hcp n=1 Tax=Neoroseomonas soli TaxID=1081025 RepID=A0A9X9X3L7_9PROT|nr:type VI secretion system tube protein Hcp [Neoroseomonas soli]MBR0673996.1 type VI secretion system tube protein Hcp [Neoroseomonas soli]